MTDALHLLPTLAPLTLPPPAVSEAEAEDWAARHWGLRGCRARRLDGEKDANFLLRLPDGGQRLLKIGHARESRPLLDMQAALVAQVARAGGPSAPQPLAATDGASVVEVGVEGEACPARLLSWIDGRPLSDHPPSPALRRALGTLAGRLIVATAGFSHPAAEHPLAWDVAQAPALRPLAEAVAPPALRPSLDALFDTLSAPQTTALMAALPRQVAHNDLNPHNVIVAGDPTEGLSVIDFGDSVLTYRIAEIAVALAYTLGDSAGWEDDAGAMLSGAFAVFTPTPQEVRALALLVETRLALSVLIPHWRAARYPAGAAYILRNAGRAATALETMEHGGRARLDALVREAAQ